MHETEYSKSPKWRIPLSKVLLPAPEGADITNRMPSERLGILIGVFTGLFDVLDLLSDPLDLCFCRYHRLGDQGIVGFYRQRVEFARDLLDQKI